MTDVTSGLDLSAGDTETLAEIRALTAEWETPLTDAEIIRAALRRLTIEWHRSPIEAEFNPGTMSPRTRTRETIAASLCDAARG